MRQQRKMTKVEIILLLCLSVIVFVIGVLQILKPSGLENISHISVPIMLVFVGLLIYLLKKKKIR